MDSPTAQTPTLCLNMIVKNESRIICRLLDSVRDIIDYYCICDTGSTDNTVELIEEYGRKHNLPGKVVHEPFRNFEYNRSYALRQCDDLDADFVLLLDADMIFWRNPKIPGDKFKQLLKGHGAFFIFQGSDAMYYKNTRIVKNRAGFSYKGVTHEYVEVPSIYSQGVLVKDIVFIQDIGDGGAKSDKFSRDVRLLKEGLDKDPRCERYMFYLANSLKDLAGTQKYQVDRQIHDVQNTLNNWKTQFSQMSEISEVVDTMHVQQDVFRVQMRELEKKLKYESIEYYKKRIEAGGFWEEVWYSYYNMGKLYLELEEVEKGMHCLQRSFILYPQRVENLYEMVKYYRERGENEMAVHFYLMARHAIHTHKSRDYLFIQRDVYDYKMDYEMTILGYYVNPTQLDMSRLCSEVLSQKGIDDSLSRNVLSNYKFYASRLSDSMRTESAQKELGELLSRLGHTSLEIPSAKFPKFQSSTPSFCFEPGNTNSILGLVRYVNYRVNDDGGYDQEEHIETKNVLGRVRKDSETQQWILDKEGFLDYDSEHDNLYIGLEDMRLFCMDGKVYYTANRGFGYGSMKIEHGWINRHTFKTEEAKHLKMEGQRPVEKNWVMFSNDNKTLRMVYNWHPIVLGVPKEGVFAETQRIETPNIFKYFRGSTNGMVVNNEIWFLCHVVSYEDRRYYYHVMVMLDKDTFSLKNYTKMFTFEGEKVEYCLGMALFDQEILFGYSSMDRETRYMSMDLSWFYDSRMLK